MAVRSKILRLKERVVNWLVRNVTIEKLRVRKLKIGNNTVVIAPDYIDLPGLSADPTLSAGRIWFRSDLSKLRWSPDGSTVSDIGGYFNLSQLTELTWDAWPTADDIAAIMEAKPLDECITLIKDIELSADFVASIFNSSNITVDKCASILNDTNITADRAAAIFNSNNISADKAAKILNSAYLDLSKVEQILKSPYLSADKAQSILYNTNFEWKKLLDLITFDASDLTVSSNTSISGIQRYKNLIIDSGYTLTVTGQTGVIIANSITVNGSIVKSAEGGAGGDPGASPGRGGNGGGGLILLCKQLSNNNIISANGEDGENGGTSNSEGHGKNGSNGIILLISGDSIGQGGDGGYDNTSLVKNNGRGNFGGGGGGYATTSYGGDGGSANITTYSTANDLYLDLRKALVDWWLQSVVGKTPTNIVSFPTIYGAGGGGGGDYPGDSDCGGGGGSGGEIIIITDLLDNAGIIQANGGNGGDAGDVGNYDVAGGGGGGGVVYILYNTANNIGAIQANGGNGGQAQDFYAGPSENGTAGTARAIQISI